MPALANSNHEAFAQHYALNGHAWQAGQSIGVSNRHKSWAIRHRQDVTARIQELVEQRFSKANITAERTMKELARIAFADIRDLYGDNGDLLPIHELSDDVAATISRVEVEIAAKEQTGEDEDGNPTRKRTMVVTKKIRQSDKMVALGLLARHFKIVGDEGDGMNALANALADRLKSARRREHIAGPPEDAVFVANPPAQLGQRLKYGLGDDPSNANDVSTPRLVVPIRDPNALHSALPMPQQQRAAPANRPEGAPREDELW